MLSEDIVYRFKVLYIVRKILGHGYKVHTNAMITVSLTGVGVMRCMTFNVIHLSQKAIINDERYISIQCYY